MGARHASGACARSRPSRFFPNQEFQSQAWRSDGMGKWRRSVPRKLYETSRHFCIGEKVTTVTTFVSAVNIHSGAEESDVALAPHSACKGFLVRRWFTKVGRYSEEWKSTPTSYPSGAVPCRRYSRGPT